MTVLWVVLGILAALAALLYFPLTIALAYQNGFKLRISYLFFHKQMIPPPQKKKTRKEKKPRKEKKADGAPEKKQSPIKTLLEQQGLSAFVRLFRELARLVAHASVRIGRKIRVRKLYLDMVVAGEDAADTAVSYGRACAELYSAFAVLHSILSMQVDAFSIIPNFDEQAKSSISFSAQIRIRPAALIRTACGLFFRFLVILIKARISQTNTEKVVQQHE